MLYLKTNKLFFLSLFLGPLIWLVVYVLLPVYSVNPVSLETILFVFCNYLCLIIGFMIFDFKDKSIPEIKISDYSLLKILAVIVAVSYLLRYIDLFILRELSFNNHVLENRALSERDFSWNYLIFYIASVFKSLYFFPFVIIVSNFFKNKKWEMLVACTLLILPIFEALLKGTRKPFFDIAIIIFFSILVFKPFKINGKKIILTIVAILTLFMISNLMLFDRESRTDRDIYDNLLSARYNDLLKPRKDLEKYLVNNETPEINKRVTITYLHLGQYLTHGLFEFNYIVDSESAPISYGSFTFNTFFNLFKNEKTNPSPREFVYITAFGGLYLDFRWFALIIIFVFGILQKFIFQKAIHSSFWRPILIYLLIINVFLPIFHYLRGMGIYPFIGTLTLYFALRYPLLKSK